MTPEIFELKNEIRVICQPAGHSRVTHLALMINAGSRNEKKGKEGLAHFLEHVFFNGTEKRK
jgi:predicted Zn-dependent peptidase